MTQALFGRTYKLTVGAVDMSSLRVSFSVEKTLKKEPNTATIKVWNLNEDSRNLLSQGRALGVLLEAGYGGDNSQIYLGQLRGAVSQIEGPDVTTTFTTGDGDKALQSARLSIPLGPKTPTQTALLAISRTLGVGLGNVSQAAAKLAGGSIYPSATVLTGSSTDALDWICHSAGLEWSIQDGQLQILDYGAALDAKPYILSAETGLVGSPSVDNNGIITAECLMLHGLRPGLRVVFDSRFVKGVHRIDEIEYTGDTHDGSWGMRLQCGVKK